MVARAGRFAFAGRMPHKGREEQRMAKKAKKAAKKPAKKAAKKKK
jgi:hypothetical protein